MLPGNYFCKGMLNLFWHAPLFLRTSHLLPPATKLGQGYVFTGVCCYIRILASLWMRKLF